MNYLKKTTISLSFTVLSIVILTFLFTMFNYFDIIGNKVMNIIIIIIPLFSVAIGGFIIGKSSLKNGRLEGIKLGLIVILLIIIGNLVLKQFLNLKDLIFYLLLLISSIFGSMFGINTKEEEN